MHGSKGWELHPDGGGGDGDVSGRHPDRRRLTFGAEHPRAKWGDASSGALTTGSVWTMARNEYAVLCTAASQQEETLSPEYCFGSFLLSLQPEVEC